MALDAAGGEPDPDLSLRAPLARDAPGPAIKPPAGASFHELPARRFLSVRLDDPRFADSDAAYDAASRAYDVEGAVVRVQATLSEASSFDPARFAAALRRRGAFSVLPIVPFLPKPRRLEGALAEPVPDAPQRPVDVAFDDFLAERSLPRGVFREEVLEAFRAAMADAALADRMERARS